MSKVTAQIVENCKKYALGLFKWRGDLVGSIETSIIHYQLENDLNDAEAQELRNRVTDSINPTLEDGE